MRYLHYLIPFCMVLSSPAQAQDDQDEAPVPTLNIGDQAPPIGAKHWYKGKPIKRYQKGRVYVVEFWATWCAPCRRAMPHLSELARQHRDKLTVIGMDIYENQLKRSPATVQHLIDSLVRRMDYTVAGEDPDKTVKAWILATGEQDNGIPNTFVIDGKGRLAWIGHPTELDKVLPSILDGSWDWLAFRKKRDFKKSMLALDRERSYDLENYLRYPAKQDSVLPMIEEYTRLEPGLRYAPTMAFRRLSALLAKDQEAALQYGREAIDCTAFDEETPYLIIYAIEEQLAARNLKPEIYQLGISACLLLLKEYPGKINIPATYHHLAKFWMMAGNSLNAVRAEATAIELLKKEPDVSEAKIAGYMLQLETYSGRFIRAQ
jgi:thiol-disulfide isomerase/thioredoxin